MSHIDNNNAATPNETMTALIAERDALKAKLAENDAIFIKLLQTFEEIDKHEELLAARSEAMKARYEDRLRYKETEVVGYIYELQALEWAINEADPSGKALDEINAKAQQFPSELFEAF